MVGKAEGQDCAQEGGLETQAARLGNLGYAVGPANNCRVSENDKVLKILLDTLTPISKKNVG